MLKFKTSCAVLGYLSSNLLNEVGLSLFRYFEVGLRVCDIVVKKFTSAISFPDEFLLRYASGQTDRQTYRCADRNISPTYSGGEVINNPCCRGLCTKGQTQSQA